LKKDLYQPKTKPNLIDVPQMTFITVDGKGDPNISKEYTAAVELLYGLSYTIKMNNKSVLEYVVPPLEGFWSVADDFRGGGAVIITTSPEKGDGVSDMSSGAEFFSGRSLEFGHVYYASESKAVKYILVTGDKAYFTIRGSYEIG
jgi:hypothetical protein